MANKRQLKKTINLMCGELFVESVAISHLQNETSREDLENVMKAILRLHDDLICRVSHPEAGMPASVFYKKLRNDLIKGTNEIADQLYALV